MSSKELLGDQSNEQSYEEVKVSKRNNIYKISSQNNDLNNQDYIRQRSQGLDNIDVIQNTRNINRNITVMTQEMMNNAAGSGSNQEDYTIHDKHNEDEDDEIDYDEFNEEGTSGGNAKNLNDIRSNYDHSIDNEDRILQGNERRGRQKQGNKQRLNNKNFRDTGRDSGEDYEEEKMPLIHSSGMHPQNEKKQKGKQIQPYGRPYESIFSNQHRSNTKHDQVPKIESYLHSISGNEIEFQTNQRQRYLDHRQNFNNDSNNSQMMSRKKDQKLSAESGGTDFNSQNPSNTNQTEELKRPSISNFRYEGITGIQGNGTPPSSSSNISNIHQMNISQRPRSPENDQMNIQSLMMNNPNYEEDVLLGENEILTPRRQEQLENESKKTSGASTPSRDGADTPTRKNFNKHQQQLGDK